MPLMDVQQLTHAILSYRHSRFRMETLPAYAVSTDGDDYHRWLRGEREPDWARKRGWLDQLRTEAAAGRRNARLRVLTDQLTDYERYSCEWGYTPNVKAGEDIRVLRHSEHEMPEHLVDRDWWLVDDATVIAMHYGPDGGFESAESLFDAVGVYRDARDAAWELAEPFEQWWARHPELHRRVAA